MLQPLWHKVVTLARDHLWYSDCKVTDTVEGRFDMITAVLSAVVVRLEAMDKHTESAFLCELFVEDMDGQLREFGINDVVVGKHIGRLMSSLGGRLGVYRPSLLNGDLGKLELAVQRNINLSEEGSALYLAKKLQKLFENLSAVELENLITAKFEANIAQ